MAGRSQASRVGGSGRRGAYTLVEILVAGSLLVVLGGGLVVLLQRGVEVWRSAESRARVQEQARLVLDAMARDLGSAATSSRPGSDGSVPWLLCDRDPRGRQRLRLVRTTSSETADEVLRQGGRFLLSRSPAVYDGRDDRREASEGRLAPPGGRMEVLWARDPRPGSRRLWRGFRSPVGGVDSFLSDRTIEEGPVGALGAGGGRSLVRSGRGSPAGKKDAPAAAADEPYAGVPFRDVARPMTDGVLFLGWSFWGPTTSTWEPTARPLRAPRAKQASGPLVAWDSTRAILDQEGAADELVFRARAGSLADPSDDIFPAYVEVTLVLSGSDRRGDGFGLRLREKVGAAELRFRLSARVDLSEDPRDRFLLVEDEWVAVDRVSGEEVTVVAGGRGVRDTRAVAHEAGSRVEAGVTFHRVVEIPGRRATSAGSEPKRKGRIARSRPK